jgi:hypothetical protein
MPAEREVIMRCLFKASGIDDLDVREIAMKTLVELVKQDYDFIEDYFNDLTQLTVGAINGDDKVSAQAIELWSSLADEEFER